MKKTLFWAIPLFLLYGLLPSCAPMDMGSATTSREGRSQKLVAAPQESTTPSSRGAGPGGSGSLTTTTERCALAGQPDGDLNAMIADRASTALGRPVGLMIHHRKRVDDWAYILGAPLELDGTPLDYDSTPYAAQSAEGMVDDVLMALARRSGQGWELVEFSIGATDAPFFDWSDAYGIPLSLFTEEGD